MIHVDQSHPVTQPSEAVQGVGNKRVGDRPHVPPFELLWGVECSVQEGGRMGGDDVPIN